MSNDGWRPDGSSQDYEQETFGGQAEGVAPHVVQTHRSDLRQSNVIGLVFGPLIVLFAILFTIPFVTAPESEVSRDDKVTVVVFISVFVIAGALVFLSSLHGLRKAKRDGHPGEDASTIEYPKKYEPFVKIARAGIIMKIVWSVVFFAAFVGVVLSPSMEEKDFAYEVISVEEVSSSPTVCSLGLLDENRDVIRLNVRPIGSTCESYSPGRKMKSSELEALTSEDLPKRDTKFDLGILGFLLIPFVFLCLAIYTARNDLKRFGGEKKKDT